MVRYGEDDDVGYNDSDQDWEQQYADLWKQPEPEPVPQAQGVDISIGGGGIPGASSGNTDRPNEITSIADVEPTRPLDRSLNTGAPSGASSTNTPSDSDGGGSDYTPARPRQPQSTPGAFSALPYDPTLGNTSPAAQSVSLRAPYISSPAQYDPMGGAGARLRSVTGGLTRGGLGVTGRDGGVNDVVSTLIQTLLRQRR